jgi:hypothetical protein
MLDKASCRLNLLGSPLGEPGGPSSKFGQGIDKSVCSPHSGRKKVAVGVAGSAEAEAGGVRRHPSELSANLLKVVVKAVANEHPCSRKGFVVGDKVKGTPLDRVKDAFAIGYNRWDRNRPEAQHKVGGPQFGPCRIVYPMRGSAMPEGYKGAVLVNSSNSKPCPAKVPLRFIEQGAINKPTKAVGVFVVWQR